MDAVMRFLWLSLICVVTACSDPEQRGEEKAAGSPSLEQAVAFPAISTAPPDSWRVRQMATRKSVDYTALLEGERPVSHHYYLYERRRGGDWIAEVWRRGDGTGEEVGHFNTKTGAHVTVRRDEAGQIISVTLEQRDDYSFDRREPTGERVVHGGESCEVWRSRAQGPGAHVLYDSCVTNDGIELWSRAYSSTGQALGHPVTVSSLSRAQVDLDTVKPPPEAFDWSYWRARAADSGVAASGDAPPDHSVWFREIRTPEQGLVIAAHYKSNWRVEHSGRWYKASNSHDYHLQGPGIDLRASADGGGTTRRSVSISAARAVPGWRPDPARVDRDADPRRFSAANVIGSGRVTRRLI